MRTISNAVVAAALTVVVAAGGTEPALAQAADPLPILGSGSTFAELAVDWWAGDVFISEGLAVDYDGIGSVGGLTQFQQGVVDFAVSDVPYAETEQAREYAYVPVVAGGIALPYRLTDDAGQRITSLRLSGRTIAGLFLGSITSWRDDRIIAENPELADRIPERAVAVAVRSPGSGTTAALTDYLSTVAPDLWAEAITRSGTPTFDGGNYTTTWPGAGTQFAGSNEIANFISQGAVSEGTIGYVETAYTYQLGLTAAFVGNASGAYRLPAAENVTAALAAATQRPDGTQALDAVHVNPDPASYPISSYSYAVVPTGDDLPAGKGTTLVRFLTYALSDEGQEQADRLGYAPLPPNLVAAGVERIRSIDGGEPPSGALVAQYADARFARRGVELRVAPGRVDDAGEVRDELELDLREERCTGRTLVRVEASARLAAPDLEGVDVAARAGRADVDGLFSLAGTRTSVPAGRGCRSPDEGSAVSEPIALEVRVRATWRPAPGSTAVEYSGTDCGGDGACWYRDAVALAVFRPSGSRLAIAWTDQAFLYEGSFPAGGPG